MEINLDHIERDTLTSLIGDLVSTCKDLEIVNLCILSNQKETDQEKHELLKENESLKTQLAEKEDKDGD